MKEDILKVGDGDLILRKREELDKEMYLRDNSEVDIEDFRNTLRSMFSQEEEPLYSPKEYDFRGLAESFAEIGKSFGEIGSALGGLFSSIQPPQETEVILLAKETKRLQNQLNRSHNYMEQQKLRRQIVENKRRLKKMKKEQKEG